LVYKISISITGIVGTTADVWQNIATQVQGSSKTGKVTPASVRLRVALNRGGLLQKLGVKSTSSPSKNDDRSITRDTIDSNLSKYISIFLY